MIEAGYNGIEFGKYSEEYFLSSIPVTYRDFFKKFTHRDTQERGDVWRCQGTISIQDFNNAIKEMHDIGNILSISFAFPDNDRYLITISVYNKNGKLQGK